MPRAKQISLNNTLIDIGDGNCEIWDLTKPHGTYSITGHSTPYADITTALSNNTSVVLRHPDGRLFYLAGNFGTGNEARYSFTYNEATTRMIIGIYSNNTITYTTPTGGAPQYHASTESTYGLGTQTDYGHVKLVDNLNQSTYTTGEALAAHQGYELDMNKVSTISGDSFASLAEFVTATIGTGKRNWAFNIKDTTGWCPLGTANTWYRGTVLYQNILGTANSIAGNIRMYGAGLSQQWIGYITGTTAAGATVTWRRTLMTSGTDQLTAGRMTFTGSFGEIAASSATLNSGGTITTPSTITATGGLYIGGSNQTYAQIAFNTTNNAANNYFIRAYDANTDGYGQNWVMKPGGNMIIGSGESATTMYSNDVDNCAKNDYEQLYLSSDSQTHVYSNCNTIANRKHWVFGTDGSFYLPDGSAKLAQDGNLYINSSANGVTGWLTTILNGKQASITGGASTITSSNLTTSRALVSNSSGKVAVASTTSTELNYLSGVTSNVQTQLNAKQATITGAASTIATSNLTASRALISNGSGKVSVSAVTSTELGYLDGVTSNVQTQINNITPVAHSSNYDEDKMNGISVTNNVNFDMGSFQLTKGSWLVTLNAQFNANATGYRQMWLSNSAGGGNLVVAGRVSSPAANGAITQINVTLPLNVSATTTYYIVVRQNSGAALITSVRYSLVRLLDQS